MAALQGAVPLAEVDDVPEGVGHHLDLDVAGGRQVPLQDQLGVAEGAGRHPPGRGQGRDQVALVADDGHTLPAPAGGGLHDQRVADLLGRLFERRIVLFVAAVAGEGRHTGRLGDPLGLVLAAHGRQHLGRRADEGQAGGLHRPSELGVFGQETEAGVDEVGPESPGRLEDPLGPQVRLGRRGRADAGGDVGHADERRAEVGFGVHGGAAQSHAAGGAEDAYRDLAPVGDEDGRNVVGIAVSGHAVVRLCHIRISYIRKTP